DAFYPPYFTPPVLIGQYEMDARMDAGLDTFALNIPPHFQRDLLAGRQPEIQLNVDATRMGQAFTGNAYVQAIVSGEIAAFVDRHRGDSTPPVELVLRAGFNPDVYKVRPGGVMDVISNVIMMGLVVPSSA